MLPATEEEEEEKVEAVLWSMSTSTKRDEDEGILERADAGATSMMPTHNVQDEPETSMDSDSKGLLIVEGGPETTTNKNRRRPSVSLTSGLPMRSLPMASTTENVRRGHRTPSATGAAELRQSGSRGGGRRSKQRGRGGGGKGKRSLLLPSPLKLQQPSPTVAFSRPSPSLTDAHSIYSSLGSTAGLSKSSSFGVITGPFTNRQGSFRNRHVRPHTADGSTSPTRSAMLIFVTTRSNFDFSGQQWQAVAGSVGSRGGRSRRGRKNSLTTRSNHHGNEDNLGTNCRGWGGEGNSSSAISYNSSLDHHPPSQQPRPKTVPLDAMHAPSHGEGEGPRTWFRDATTTSVHSARRQQLLPLRGESRSGVPDKIYRDVSDDYHRRGVRRARARTAASLTRRTGLTGSGEGGIRCPKDRILSPERAAARLASMRKAYGRESASPFRGSSLHATASLKSAPSAAFSACRGGT